MELSQVAAEYPGWVLPGLVPAGVTVVIGAQEGAPRICLASLLGVAITGAGYWPSTDLRRTGSVLYFTTCTDVSRVIKAYAMAAGSDGTGFHVEPNQDPFDWDIDLDRIKKYIAKIGRPAAVLIDAD